MRARSHAGHGFKALSAPLVAAAMVIAPGLGAASASASASASNNSITFQAVMQPAGSQWTQVPTANPGSSNTLSAVAATSATNAWAVGIYTSQTGFQTLIEHWNGTTWTQTPSPTPAGSSGDLGLTAVAATSATNAWAVGFTAPPPAR